MSSESSQLDMCLKCKGECCRYVSLPFETPKKKKDFDEVRWYLLHENTWVYIDDENDWHIEFRAKCENLSDDSTCLDYENRPSICRDYPRKDDTCEFEGEGSPYKVIFKTRDDLEKYLKKLKKKRKDKKNKKKKNK